MHLETGCSTKSVLGRIGLAALLVYAVLLFSGRTCANLRRPPISIAVLGFEATTPGSQDSWLTSALAEIVSTSLRADKRLRVVDMESVEAIRRDVSMKSRGPLTGEDLERLAPHLQADFVITGSCGEEVHSPLRSISRLHVYLQDTLTGKVHLARRLERVGTDPFGLASEANRALLRALRRPQLSPSETAAVRSLFPHHKVSAQLYFLGLHHQLILDARKARDLFRKALEIEEHPTPRAALASVLWNLDDIVEARRQARIAMDEAAGLKLESWLDHEARLHGITEDWDKVTSIYRSQLCESSADVDLTLQMVSAQLQANRPRDALLTLDRLRGLAMSRRQEAQADLLAASAYKDLRELSFARDLVVKAVATSEKLGAVDLNAKARLLQAKVYDQLGDIVSADHCVRTSLEAAEKSASYTAVREALLTMAILYKRRGNLARTRDLLLGLLTHAEARAGTIVVHLGNVLAAAGDLGDARDLLEDATGVVDRVGSTAYRASARLELGTVYRDLGELDKARRLYEEALPLLRDDPGGTATALTRLGEIFFLRGELEEASRRHHEALEIHIGMDRYGAAYDGFRLGKIALARGHLELARDRFLRAHALLEGWKNAEDRSLAARVDLGQAEIEFHRDNFHRAALLAEKAELGFRATQSGDQAVLARTLLAKTYLARKRVEEARKIHQETVAYAEGSESLLARFATAILEARLRAISAGQGAREEALRLLEDVATEAERREMVPSALPARLTMAEIELDSGRLANATKRLGELIADAGGGGFGLLVDQARKLRRP